MKNTIRILIIILGITKQDFCANSKKIPHEKATTFHMNIDEKEDFWNKLAKKHNLRGIYYNENQDFFYARNAFKKLMKGEREVGSLPKYVTNKLSLEGPTSISWSNENAKKKFQQATEEIQKKLPDNYKIHLMPTDYNIDQVFNDLLSLLSETPQLQDIINTIKIYGSYEKTRKQKNNEVLPRIVTLQVVKKMPKKL